MKNQRSKLLTFWEENQDNAKPFGWLQGRSYSEAFVICIGAGPWKYNRRKTIQGQALERLGGRDLLDIILEEDDDWYPLKWQNDFLFTTVRSLLKINGPTFQGFCSDLAPEYALSNIRKLARTKNAKVISLFCRDALQVPSFPIDRHVRRKLKELELPTDEDTMIKICTDVGIDPRLVAVAMVRTASDMDNPDWSIK